MQVSCNTLQVSLVNKDVLVGSHELYALYNVAYVFTACMNI